MAQPSNHCTNHGTGTEGCAGHRASCAANRAITFTSATQNGLIRASDVNTLRTSIRDELARYHLHRSFPPSSVPLRQGTAYVGGVTRIDNTHINELELMVQQTINVTEPSAVRQNPRTEPDPLIDPPDATTAANSYADNAKIFFTHWSTLNDKYNLMRQDCICNADCACNLVCNCHNNCGCNYSDERLKENIEFVKVKNGLNIYTWNYIWNKTKRYSGVMAHEILKTKYASAVSEDSQGFYMVNYSKLPL
jgi:hypothetical protein